MEDDDKHIPGLQIYRLPIHYDVAGHTLSIDTAIQGLVSIKGVIKELEEQLFKHDKNYISSTVLVSVDEEGGLKQVLQILMMASGLVLPLGGIEESENFAQFMKQIHGEEYEAGQIGFHLGRAVKLFMEEDAEKIENIAPERLNLNKAKKYKSDFYQQCLNNQNIKGLEFSDENEFPIKRKNFSSKISNNSSKDTKSEFKLYKDIILVSAVEIDRDLAWRFQETNSPKIIKAYMEDYDFKKRFLEGLYPLKTSVDHDKMSILLKEITTIETGAIRRIVKDVYKFNETVIKAIPSSFDEYELEIIPRQRDLFD